jgi:hypothetical protein
MKRLRAGCVFDDARISSLKRPPAKWPAIMAILALTALCLLVGWSRVADVSDIDRQFDSSSSPYAAAADFTKYIMKLCNAAVLKAEPTVKLPGDLHTPWKLDIVTTVFWIGEPAGPNNPMSNVRSSWDVNWTANYGGYDPPETSNRRDYIPVAFVPRQNPFYVALPYNDMSNGEFKPEAPLIIPWFREAHAAPGQSLCKGHWVAIRKGNRICYAQWEDCGPFRTDNFQYVFGNERPEPNANGGAGLDVSPAVRDYLGLQSTDVTDWQFVEVRDVPPGPWQSYGDNNHFVLARRQSEPRVAVAGSGAAKLTTEPKTIPRESAAGEPSATSADGNITATRR